MQLQTYQALVLQGFGQLLTRCRGSSSQTGESQQHQTDADGHVAKSNKTNCGCGKGKLNVLYFFKKRRGNNATAPLLQGSCSVSYQTGRGINIRGGRGRDVGRESAGR